MNKSIQYIQRLLDKVETNKFIKSDDIPNIDLYMDQVRTFINGNVELLRRENEEKALTKTMINNYTKNDILPPPIKKKYSRNHMILLLYIYHLKSTLSIMDIKKLLDPIKHIFLNEGSDISLDEFYDMLIDLEENNFSDFKQGAVDTVKVVEKAFSDLELDNPDHKEKLELFTIIYLLTIQASAQKLLAEHLIDKYFKSESIDKDKKS